MLFVMTFALKLGACQSSFFCSEGYGAGDKRELASPLAVGNPFLEAGAFEFTAKCAQLAAARETIHSSNPADAINLPVNPPVISEFAASKK